MPRAYFSLTYHNAAPSPTLTVNGRALHLTHKEFFELMKEAAWLASALAPAPTPSNPVESYYHDLDNY
jgi:hypothetical protein